MKCDHPSCTGMHDNNRYRELCPAALERKRDKDDRYYSSDKGSLNRIRKVYWDRPAMRAEMENFITSGRFEQLAMAAMESDDPLEFIMRASFTEVFGDMFGPNFTALITGHTA